MLRNDERRIKYWGEMMRSLSLFLLILLYSHIAIAEAEKLDQTRVSYGFMLDGEDNIQGDAKEWLFNHGRDARFVMVGEVHGVADVARFSKSLYGLTERTALAIETDLWSAKLLEALAGGDDNAFENYFERRSHQYSIPFYSWQEEADLLKYVVKKADGIKPSLWGLDQVFLLGARNIVEYLRPRLKREESLKTLDAFENILITRPAFVGYGEAEIFERLYLELLKEEDANVQEAAEALKSSNEIYAPFTRGNGIALRSNQTRERQMKQTFFTYFSNARKYVGLQKPMLKFGRYHMYRGITPTGVTGLGGFVDALAVARNENALSLSIFCGEGSKARQFDGSSGPCMDKGMKENYPLLSKLSEEADGNLLVDTQALRTHNRDLMKLASDEEKNQFAAFDAIVIIKNSAAATQFNAAIEDMDLAVIFESESQR
jgi:hypothetical protein